MNLFEVNRFKFFKIFETHQFKGFLSFADVSNLCTLLKLCPDLITIQEVQKIFLLVSAGGYSKITLVEFEDLIKTLATQLFYDRSINNDPLKSFITHIKDSALNTYGISLNTHNPPKKSHTSIVIRSTQNLKRKKSLKRQSYSSNKLPGSHIIPYQEVNPKSLEHEKSHICRAKPNSPTQSLNNFKSRLKNSPIKNYLVQRNLKIFHSSLSVYHELQILKRLCFIVWKLT